MPHVPDRPAAGADARATLSTRGLQPADINPDEMDDVTMRIFHELRKQLSMMECKKAEQLTTQERESHARILATLERTMERLVKVEAGRTAARKNQMSVKDGSRRNLLLRKLTVQATLEQSGEDERSVG
ncbi:MAG: hypothetical protein JO208_05685 [Alphaproteobacteria bacterium]|nr:hypothetical protein [Alphaproteobacteria bacterium]